MRTTDYLYDCLPSVFMHLTYVDALKLKVDLTSILLKKLRITFDAHTNLNREIADTIMQRYLDVEKARKFNQGLLEELRSEVEDDIIMI